MKMHGETFRNSRYTGLFSVASGQATGILIKMTSTQICLPFPVTIYVLFRTPYNDEETLDNMKKEVKINSFDSNQIVKLYICFS
jgi:hypothetical protein